MSVCSVCLEDGIEVPSVHKAKTKDEYFCQFHWDMRKTISFKCFDCEERVGYWVKYCGSYSKSIYYCKDCASTQNPDTLHINPYLCMVCHSDKAVFAEKGKVATHCKECKLDGMSNLYKGFCEKCQVKRAIFGYKYRSPLRCGLCKDEMMKDCMNKLCVVCDKKRPNYGFVVNMQSGKLKPPTHCGDCKVYGMSDIRNKKCEYCNKRQGSRYVQNVLMCSGCETNANLNKKCLKCAKRIALFGYLPNHEPTHCYMCKEMYYGVCKNMLCHKCGECAKYLNNRTEYVCEGCKTEDCYSIMVCEGCNKNKNGNLSKFCLDCFFEKNN